MKRYHRLSTIIDIYSINIRVFRPSRIPSYKMLIPQINNQQNPALRIHFLQLHVNQMYDECTRGRNHENVKVNGHDSQ
jgi:hypothetical protein